jgi:hypothetical protein
MRYGERGISDSERNTTLLTRTRAACMHASTGYSTRMGKQERQRSILPWGGAVMLHLRGKTYQNCLWADVEDHPRSHLIYLSLSVP